MASRLFGRSLGDKSARRAATPQVAPVLFQPALQNFHGRYKVVPLEHQQVDVVKILATAEAVEVTIVVHANLSDIDSNPVFR